MKGATKFVSGQMLLAIIAVFGVWFSAFPIPANAQGTQGQNAVCSSSSGCSTQAGSSAFIDASMFASSPPPPSRNLCGVLNFVLNPLNGFITSAGAVIDARGLTNDTPPTSMTCTTTNPSPWAGIANPPPSTILLPATGTSPIVIPSTWVLPNNTKLIGEGTTNPSLNSGGSAAQTTIQASSSFASGTPMMQFGNSSLCPSSGCTGISIESLTLYGNSNSIIGIENENSQDLSYADHVTLYHILGTGLVVSGSAQRSGPYTNINYDTGGSGVSGSVCAQIKGLTSTHGIHGLSCASSPDSLTAVLLDSSSNTLEDVRIAGFYDGILVGSQAWSRNRVYLLT